MSQSNPKSLNQPAEATGGDSAPPTRREFIADSGRVIGGLSLLSGSSLLTATSAAAATRAAASTLVVAQVATPPTIDTDQEFSFTGTEIAGHCYGGDIFRWNYVRSSSGILLADVSAGLGPTDGVSPGLAQSYRYSKDLRTITVKLRTDAGSYFGNPLTAQDIAWSHQRSLQSWSAFGGFFNTLEGTQSLKAVEVVNSTTVRFHLSGPRPFFFKGDVLRNMEGPLDITEVKKHTTSSDPWAKDWLSKNTAGFGPYQLQSLQPGVGLTLVANPHYYGPKPALSKVIWRVIPNASDQLAALARGDIDVVGSLSPQQIESLKHTPGVRTASVITNLTARIIPNVLRKPFGDVRVRQALAYAIPYEQIIKDVYFGNAIQPRSVLTKSVPGYTPDYWTYDTNPSKAAALLKAAGVPKFSFELVYDTSVATSTAMLNILRTAFADIGVTMNLRGVTNAAYSALLGTNNYDMIAALYDEEWGQDPGYVLTHCYSSAGSCTFGGWGTHTPAGAQMTKIALALNEEVNVKKRVALARKGQQLFAQQMPVLYLANFAYQIAYRDTLRDFAWVPANTLFYPFAKRV